MAMARANSHLEEPRSRVQSRFPELSYFTNDASQSPALVCPSNELLKRPAAYTAPLFGSATTPPDRSSSPDVPKIRVHILLPSLSYLTSSASEFPEFIWSPSDPPVDPTV